MCLSFNCYQCLSSLLSTDREREARRVKQSLDDCERSGAFVLQGRTEREERHCHSLPPSSLSTHPISFLLSLSRSHSNRWVTPRRAIQHHRSASSPFVPVSLLSGGHGNDHASPPPLCGSEGVCVHTAQLTPPPLSTLYGGEKIFPPSLPASLARARPRHKEKRGRGG